MDKQWRHYLHRLSNEELIKEYKDAQQLIGGDEVMDEVMNGCNPQNDQQIDQQIRLNAFALEQELLRRLEGKQR